MKKILVILGTLLLICTLLFGCVEQPMPPAEEQSSELAGQVTTVPEQSDTELPTDEPTTEDPTTEEPTTEDPTTEEPTTEQPTTEESTTETPSEPPEDPYINMSSAEFYSDYQPADDYWDSYWRTEHGFMSGSIEPQDQKPTISEYQPMEDGKFVRNSHAAYSADGNTYYVVDAYGQVVMEIYKCGAYVSLEEVAAYVFAFGDIPVNYSSNKKTDPEDSIWGQYLRVNHTQFSGDTSRYPYEPELPNISGCGGSFKYYEIDIGTTGTDCDPKYRPALYNNGVSITRGAARIVYARMDLNGNEIIDPDEKFVFYTYNHYNDFQEYLNYYGGWGEMFGNITGGGAISSKTNCNPTPYVPVVHRDLVSGVSEQARAVTLVLYYVPKLDLLGMAA